MAYGNTTMLRYLWPQVVILRISVELRESDPMERRDHNEIRKKGFDRKWWVEKAAKNCMGIGVEKALDKCKKAGIGRDGFLDNGATQEKQFKEANAAYDALEAALKTARSKCGKAQDETKQGIAKFYLPRIADAKKKLDDAEKTIVQAKAAASGEEKAKKEALEDLEGLLKPIDDFATKVFEREEGKINSTLMGLVDAVREVEGMKSSSHEERVERLDELIRDAEYLVMTKELRRLRAIFDSLNERFKKIARKHPTQKDRLLSSKGRLSSLSSPLASLEAKEKDVKARRARIKA